MSLTYNQSIRCDTVERSRKKLVSDDSQNASLRYESREIRRAIAARLFTFYPQQNSLYTAGSLVINPEPEQ